MSILNILPFEHPSWAFWKLWAFWTSWAFWALWTYYLLSSMGVLNIVSILNKNKKTVQNCYPLYIVVSWAFWKIAIMLNIWPFEHCDNFEHCDHFEHFTVWTSVHHRPTLPFGARQLLNFRWIQFKRRTELKANWAWGKERAEYCKERQFQRIWNSPNPFCIYWTLKESTSWVRKEKHTSVVIKKEFNKILLFCCLA